MTIWPMKSQYFELTEKHARSLLKLANAGENDIFLDIGCGTGIPVIEAIRYAKVKKSLGVELDYDYYKQAQQNAIKKLSKEQLSKIDFWYGNIYDEKLNDEYEFIFNYNEATIVFNSIDEQSDDLDFYQNRFDWKNVKIIKKDIPLVGFESEINNDNYDCYFFLMKHPFKKISREKWIKSIDKNFKKIDDVYTYYFNQLYHRFKQIRLREKTNKKTAETKAKQDAMSTLLALEILINERF